MASLPLPARKAALEALLREQRLLAEAPPLRGEDRRLGPLATGAAAVDALLAGGFPRGALSELRGPASSGRTGLLLSTLAQATRRGALSAWLDPGDRFDPASAAAAGADLARLLWLRGERGRQAQAVVAAAAAAATLVGSGLFELVVLDLAGIPASDRRRLPGATWVRLQRMLEDGATALVLLAEDHVVQGPGGVSLELTPAGPRWSGSGPGRLLRGLAAEVRVGRHGVRRAALELAAVS